MVFPVPPFSINDTDLRGLHREIDIKICETCDRLPTTMNVRGSDQERDIPEKLSKYLRKVERIGKPTLSDAMRGQSAFHGWATS